MPTRFDHAVILVRDLDTAIAQFQHLGFDAQKGGKHSGRGTHNALIRFGLDYIELLSVYDEAEVRAASPDGRTLLDVLAGRESVLVGYALATATLEQDAERFTGTGDTLPRPNPMQRARPDGHLLTWRTLAAGSDRWDTWGKPWPFLIQWDMPDDQRLQIDRPGSHANGATAWVKISILARDLDSTADVYQQQLGLNMVERTFLAEQVAHRLTFSIGNGTIEIQSPSEAGPTQQILDSEGEGPYALHFTAKDLQQTRAFLQERGIQYTQTTARGIFLLLGSVRLFFAE